MPEHDPKKNSLLRCDKGFQALGAMIVLKR